VSAPAPRTPAPVAKDPILVIDDEKDLVRLIQRRLEVDGYKVVSASSAESGLAAVRAAAPALILLDIQLPAMDGLSFLRLLRRESEIPVILLSGRASDADRILGLKAGADDYVTKPFSLSELAARVECILRRRAKNGVAKNGVKKRRPSA
jgi:OmpR family response regulator RpaB